MCSACGCSNNWSNGCGCGNNGGCSGILPIFDEAAVAVDNGFFPSFFNGSCGCSSCGNNTATSGSTAVAGCGGFNNWPIYVSYPVRSGCNGGCCR